MHKPLTLPLHSIPGTPYARVLNYPARDDSQIERRLEELNSIGVTSLRYVGPSIVGGLNILGKGWVGLVAQAILDNRVVALKIRRLDADRPSMFEEARLLRLANSVNVGPRLIAATRNFLVAEFIPGLPLFKWGSRSTRSRSKVRSVLRKLMDDCFRLDSIGLDHGELSHAHKNVLVAREDACIVDFESASTARKVANVTSLVQYFIFGNIRRTLQDSNIFPQKTRILPALAEYKRDGSVANYHSALVALRLANEPA